MENATSLIREVDNLLTNPTEDALKSFGCFLQNENIAKSELAIWALAKPCQIVPLVKLVVNHNHDLKNIFRSLAVLPTFVNAALETNTSLVEDLLSRTAMCAASNSPQDQGFHCAAVVAHHTLKREALPDSNLRLVRDAIISAADNPTQANLRCLSKLLSARAGNILDLFTEELLNRLSTRCNEVCSGSTKKEEYFKTMLAQDILAQVAVAFQSPQTPSKSSLETPPGVRFSEKCRKRVFKLFSGSNASSVLKITVLYLSVFCSDDPESSPLLLLEGMILAQRIIAPISVPVRRQWAKGDPPLIEKFLSRLGREALGLNARLEGVMFCLLLFGADDEMPLSLEKVASAVLVAICDPKFSYDSAMATGNDKAIAEILVRLCSSRASPNRTLPGKSAVFVTRMLSFIVEQCQPWCTNALNTVLKLHQAKNILNSLHSASNRPGVLPCIDFIELGYVPDWWGSEATFPLSFRDSEVVNCIGEEVCSKSLEGLRLELATGLSSLLLTAAWQSGRSLQQPETCQRLLNRLKGFSWGPPGTLSPYSCDHTMPRQYNVALLDAQDECRFLRARLVSEIMERNTLEAQLAQTKTQLAQTKRLLAEEKDASNAIELYLESSEEECFEKGERLRQAREDYTKLLAEADRRVQEVKCQYAVQEVEYRAELLSREKELEKELEEVLTTLEHKDEELHLQETKRENIEADMKAALAQADAENEELRSAVAEKDKALEEAESLRARLMALLGDRVD